MSNYSIFLGIVFLMCLTTCNVVNPLDDFGQTTEHEREIDAIKSRWNGLAKVLRSSNISTKQFDLFIRVFKLEEELEIWAKNKDDERFVHLKTHAFCVNSGILGPKRREGDLQIPEGIYHIEGLNPKSKFLLSLRVNYPNASDLLFADKDLPGSDIYIHGACSSVGCVSIDNSAIQELYILVLKAQQTQSKIPVYFFPTKAFDKLEPAQNDDIRQLWESLSAINNVFEVTKNLPKSELVNGYYQLKK